MFMQGTIANFRSSRHRQTGNQMVVLIDGVDSREKADGLVGKEVTWKSPAGKELKGKVSGAHGNSGAVKVHFTTGMPGQSVGKKVEIN